MLCSLLAEVEKQIAAPVRSNAIRSRAVSLYFLGVESSVSDEMFRAVSQHLDDGKPRTRSVYPRHERLLVADVQCFPREMVRAEPVAPYPLMEMVSGYGAMNRTPRGLLVFDELIEILYQDGVEILGAGNIEHGL